MSEIPPMDYGACLFHEKKLRSVEANTRGDGEGLLGEAADGERDESPGSGRDVSRAAPEGATRAKWPAAEFPEGTIGGIVSGRMNLSGRVEVTADLLVLPGATLTLSPGSELVFGKSESTKVDPEFFFGGTELVVRQRPGKVALELVAARVKMLRVEEIAARLDARIQATQVRTTGSVSAPDIGAYDKVLRARAIRYTDAGKDATAEMIAKDVGSWEGSKPPEEQYAVFNVHVQTIPNKKVEKP